MSSSIHRGKRFGKQVESKSEQGNIKGFFIPQTEKQWNKLERSVKSTNVHKLNKSLVQSGSKTTDIQFLAYRTLYCQPMSRFIFATDMQTFGITDEIRQAADDAVLQSNEFSRFISVTKMDISIEYLHEDHEYWPGSWVSVKGFQEDIESSSRTATRWENEGILKAAEALRASFTNDIETSSSLEGFTRTSRNERSVQSGGATVYQVSGLQKTVAMSNSNFPDADDESIVNTYAIILLQQTSRLLKYFLVKWTMDRIKLDASFDLSKYSAYTDGGLRPQGGGLIQASVEVKRGIRTPNIVDISKQETSQVVAMIQKGCRPIYNGHWLVVSFDRHEAYLNFSSCEPEYVQYICNGAVVPKSFLKTQTLGPWKITDASEIAELVHILVALTLKANLVSAEAISNGEIPVLDETEEQRDKNLQQLRGDDGFW